MSQQPLFSSGLELANLVLNSGLVQLSWNQISKALEVEAAANPFQRPSSFLSLRCEFDRQSNCTVIAFITSPICTQEHLLQEGDLVPSATLQQEFPLFDFLCSIGNPCFSIHRAAITLFKNHFHQLSDLKSQVFDSTTCQLSLDKPLIITGYSLGGSIASLFTLWLLDSINQFRKRYEPPARLPLCITFGAPLLGDQGVQRAISERSKWKSCFLHIAANKDPFPRLFMPPHNPQATASSSAIPFKPFGTYLLCSDLGCTCVEDPEGVLKLLESKRSQVSNGESPMYDYKPLVENLNSRLLIKGNSQVGQSITCPLQHGLILQLEAIGVDMAQQPLVNILIVELEKQEKLSILDRRKAMDPMKKLNNIKKKMAHLEWYKKDRMMKSIGYYDSYKKQLYRSDIEAAKHKKALTNYWKRTVEEAEKKPQKEGLFIRLSWLYSGTNYRRMVEPLEIADYYRNGNRDYRSKRTLDISKHFHLLQQWQDDDLKKKPAERPNDKKKKSVAGILTEDSCFWADVEEALIACDLLKNETTSAADRESAERFLISFQEYAMQQIGNYAVSPEIFLSGSSFMNWWKAFQEMVSPSYESELVKFMNNRGPRRYEEGSF